MRFHPETVPSSEQVRETLLDQLYYPYRKQIWAAGIVLAVVVVTFLALREQHRSRLDDQWNRYFVILDTQLKGDDGAYERIEMLETLIRDYPEAPVTPSAMKAIVDANITAKDWDGARTALADLRKRYPDFLLFDLPRHPKDPTSNLSVGDWLGNTIEGEEQWEKDTTYTPPVPTGDKLALVETNLGDFWIGFYEDLAPKHVEEFIRRAKAGFFNGTQIYHIRRRGEEDAPLLFEAGSAASKTHWTKPETHNDDDPTATIEPEDALFRARHHRLVVSAVLQPSGESAARFMIITSITGMVRYNNQTTPFGTVIPRENGETTVDAIGRAPTYGTHPDTREATGILRVRDHPYPYVYIRRLSIWRNEVVDEGHTWDTSRAGESGEPEPWEAELPEAWKPEPPEEDEDAGDDEAGEDGEPGDDTGDEPGDEPGDDENAGNGDDE